MVRKTKSIYDPTIISAAADASNENDHHSTSNSAYLEDDSGIPRGDLQDVMYEDAIVSYDGGRPAYRDNFDGTDEFQRTDIMTEHITTQKTSCRRKVCYVATVLIAIAAIVGTAVGVSNAKKNASSSKSASTVSTVQLEPIPADFEEMCMEAFNDSSSQQTQLRAGPGKGPEFTACKKICQNAKCCDVAPDQDGSCLTGNEMMCLEYHHQCQALKPFFVDDTAQQPAVDYVVPEAPADLAYYCSYSSLVGNFEALQKCEQYCMPNRCCYDTGVAHCGEQEACNGYSPCYNLRVYQAEMQNEDEYASSVSDESEPESDFDDEDEMESEPNSDEEGMESESGSLEEGEDLDMESEPDAEEESLIEINVDDEEESMESEPDDQSLEGDVESEPDSAEESILDEEDASESQPDVEDEDVSESQSDELGIDAIDETLSDEGDMESESDLASEELRSASDENEGVMESESDLASEELRSASDESGSDESASDQSDLGM